MKIFAIGKKRSSSRTQSMGVKPALAPRPALNRISGNVFFALFAAVAMVGGVGYGFNTVLRGPMTSMTEVTRRTVAESTIVTSSRMAIVGATTQAVTTPDCDGDGMVEPLQFRVPGAGLPAPTGGGYLPSGLVQDSTDPWNTEYGYCAWDSSPPPPEPYTVLQPACGTPANRLAGAPNNTQYAVAVISAGKDKIFQTTCVAYNGTTPTAALITNVQGSDDIVLGYSYAEANDLGAGMWKINPATPTVAETSNALEVERGGTFTDGVVLAGNTTTGGGLRLPESTGGADRTGPCNNVNDKQIRRNISTIPPTLEICNSSGGFTDWLPLSGSASGGGGGGTMTGSIVAHWKLDEMSGTMAEDSVGSADGTLVNGPTWQPASGMNGGALSFNAPDNEYVRIPRSAVLEPTSITVSIWAKRAPGAQDGFGTLFYKSYQDNVGPEYTSYGLQMDFDDDDQLIFQVGRTGGYDLINDIPIPENTWTNYIAVIDSAANQMKIYINGTLFETAARTGPMVYDPTSTGDLWISSTTTSPGEKFTGALDDFRIYNYAMTDAEALSLYNNSGQQYFKNNAPAKAGRGFSWGEGDYSGLGTGSAGSSSLPVPILNGDNVVQIAAGYWYACMLKAGGNVWCWGSQEYGQLGNGSLSAATVALPTPIQNFGNVVKIAGGSTFSCALKRDGTVWCWGQNGSGQLGLGDTTNRAVPTKIPTLENIIDIAAGNGNTCAVDRTGIASCWGQNPSGALGNGTTTASLVPSQVSNITNFVSLSKSTVATNACGITRTGEGYCWGANNRGHLGNNTTSASSVPVRVIKDTGTGYWTDWVKIVPSSDFTCGLRANGTLWCWGSDDYAQLGNGFGGDSNRPVQVRRYPDFVDVATYGSGACGVRKNGELHCWGLDDNGERGNGPLYTSNAHDAEPALINNAIKVFASGDAVFAITDTDKRPIPIDAARPSRIKAGSQHACALDRDSSLWCWGDNGNSQIGNGTTGGTRDVPVRVAGTWAQLAPWGMTNLASCAIRNDGVIACWGDDTLGLMGNGASGNQTAPAPIVTTGPWAHVSMSQQRACAIKSDGTMWCWGTDASGAAIQTPAAIISANGTRWRQLALAHNLAVCGITVNDEILCTGNATGGLLGNRQTSGSFTEAPLIEKGPWQSISANSNAFCAIKQDGSMWCWGTDTFGLLGSYQTAPNQGVPWPVAEPGPWAKVSMGGNAVCAVKVDGSAWCWGNNDNGALGAGLSTGNYIYPVRVVGDGFTDINVGNGFACGMKRDDTVWCWGNENYDQLGNGSPAATRNTPVKVSGLPHREPWSVNTNGSNNDLLPGLNADIGSTRYISGDGGGTYGLNFLGSGRSQITSPLANNFMVESMGTGGDAQISLKAAGARGVPAMPSGMIAWWRMEETSGTTVYDTVGGNNGTWTGSGGILSTTGRVGNALNLTADTTWVDLGTAPGLTGVYPVTVAAWIYPRTNNCQTASGICSIIYATDYDGPISGGWSVNLTTSRQVRMLSEYGAVDAETTQTVPLNAWTHIVTSWSPPDVPKIYINGVAATLSSPPASTMRPDDVGTLKGIGSAASVQDWNLDGLIDEVQVYNRALDATEALRIYNATSGTSFVEVIRSFGMDYTSGNFKIARNTTGANSWLGALTPDLEINNLGEVGVGTGGSPQAKLDVNGGLRLGNDGGACNAGKAGGMQWTGTLMQYCDGVSWKTFGIGGASTILWDTRKEAMQSPSCALRVNGTMWCWGDDWWGYLGRGTNDQKSLQPVATHSDVSPTPWTDWTMASGSCGLRANGTMWCWGPNVTGRIGRGDTLSGPNRPVQVLNNVGGPGWTDWKKIGKIPNETNTCGIRADGSAWCWGSGVRGQLGNGTTPATQTLPVQVQTNTGPGAWNDWAMLSVGDEEHICGIRTNGTAWCWGRNWGGGLGDNTLTQRSRPVQVLNNSGGAGWTDWKYIALGSNTTCGLRTNGTAWCWGGTSAAMGEGTGAQSSLPKQWSSNCGNTFNDIVAIDTSGHHTCAIRANGSLWCSGFARSGGVGAGDLNDYYCPIEVKDSTGTTAWYDWVNISTQYWATCGMRSNGQYYCWGGTMFEDVGRYYPTRMR